jgi:RNA polymerase sigma-70 factor (ECF subfamily)
VIPIAISSIADDGDRLFMTRLYTDFHALMLRRALAIVGSREDAEDAVSDACVKLLGKLPTLRALERPALATYVVHTVKSVAIDLVRRRDTKQNHEFLGQDGDAAEAVADVGDGSDFESLVLDAEAAKAAVRHLDRLDERDMDILKYKYVLDMTDKEIAPLMGVKPQSIRGLLTRARRNALELLRKGGIESATDV